MGHKIFVSYKYADTNVAALPGQVFSSARDYVTALEHKLDRSSQIYKGEGDGEDLSNLTEEQIWAKLRDRIYDTSVTIVFISRGMKEPKPEWWQWIPWEISYSLKEIPRGDRVSRTNAVFAVVLPDASGSYEYFMHSQILTDGQLVTTYLTDGLFPILRLNMFNRKDNTGQQTQLVDGSVFYTGEFSYIFAVPWGAFFNNVAANIDRALRIQTDVSSYKITKTVSFDY